MLLEANQRAASGGSIGTNPVTLPPGHATLATKASPIGSPAKVKTIGTSGCLSQGQQCERTGARAGPQWIDSMKPIRLDRM
jgi:hypothetical protein